jgi:hypothetical protein
MEGEADCRRTPPAQPRLTRRHAEPGPRPRTAILRCAADLIARLEPFLSLAQFRTKAVSAFALLSGALGQTRLPCVAALSFLRR